MTIKLFIYNVFTAHSHILLLLSLDPSSFDLIPVLPTHVTADVAKWNGFPNILFVSEKKTLQKLSIRSGFM